MYVYYLHFNFYLIPSLSQGITGLQNSYPLSLHPVYYNLKIFTARKQSCLKVMYLHLSVSHYVHGWVYNPLGKHLPPTSEMATEAGGTLPTGMHSCSLIIVIFNY